MDTKGVFKTGNRPRKGVEPAWKRPRKGVELARRRHFQGRKLNNDGFHKLEGKSARQVEAG
jgi:hypothetical protein